jgi:arylsulfatase A-like enzyme
LTIPIAASGPSKWGASDVAGSWCTTSLSNSKALKSLGIMENTIVVINGDHGETLYDHECWFDHHGMYDNVLHVPQIIRYPAKLPQGIRIKGYNQHKDLMPTLLELAGLLQNKIKWNSNLRFDGRSLLPMIEGKVASHESEFYITECTWMRKHGWRTPHWKTRSASSTSTSSQRWSCTT